jgi:hypothetical protein
LLGRERARGSLDPEVAIGCLAINTKFFAEFDVCAARNTLCYWRPLE